MGPSWRPSWAILAVLEAILDPLRASWGPLGRVEAMFGRLGTLMGRLGALLDRLEAFWLRGKLHDALRDRPKAQETLKSGLCVQK